MCRAIGKDSGDSILLHVIGPHGAFLGLITLGSGTEAYGTVLREVIKTHDEITITIAPSPFQQETT